MTSQAPSHASRRGLPIAGIASGGILALIAVLLLGAGGVLLWASATKTDDGGWWTSSEQRYASSTRALTTQRLDVGSDAPDWMFGSAHLADVRIRAASTGAGTPVFVGIGPTQRVQAYLHDVAHDELTDLGFDPLRSEFARRPGTRTRLGAPAAQRFWAAAANGTGRQTLTWPVRRGRWSVVVMNADASPGVAVRLSAAAKVPLVHELGVGLLVGGGVLGLGAAMLVGLGAAGLSRRTAAPEARVPAPV